MVDYAAGSQLLGACKYIIYCIVSYVEVEIVKSSCIGTAYHTTSFHHKCSSKHYHYIQPRRKTAGYSLGQHERRCHYLLLCERSELKGVFQCAENRNWNRDWNRNAMFHYAENRQILVEVTSQKNIGLGSADFLHSGTGYIKIAVFVPCQFQSRCQSRFSTQWNTAFTAY